ncbi:MAG: phosphodiester glycosidase family protein [Armatimonadetes bacterium]|nr:phosphodiester glycosidase family protein [Armatimonadota bacterium]
MIRRFLCLAAGLAALGAGAQTAPAPPSEPLSGVSLGAWRPCFVGVDHALVRCAGPVAMQGQALRIDLRAKGLRFMATPPARHGKKEVLGLRTSSFVARYRMQGAINAAPFGPVVDDEGKDQDVVGLMVSNSRLVSKPEASPALLLTGRNKAVIAEAPFILRGIRNAVAGFGLVLKAGVNVGAGGVRHPRTAAGISPDGRTLYLLALDGRQTGYSLGATTQEVGQWLALLGASEGINLDGGGTTAMVIQGADGKPHLLNRPIHGGVPGAERVSASHLGFRARRLRASSQP